MTQVSAVFGDVDVPWWAWLALVVMLVMGPLVKGFEEPAPMPDGKKKKK